MKRRAWVVGLALAVVQLLALIALVPVAPAYPSGSLSASANSWSTNYDSDSDTVRITGLTPGKKYRVKISWSASYSYKVKQGHVEARCNSGVIFSAGGDGSGSNTRSGTYTYTGTANSNGVISFTFWLSAHASSAGGTSSSYAKVSVSLSWRVTSVKEEGGGNNNNNNGNGNGGSRGVKVLVYAKIKGRRGYARIPVEYKVRFAGWNRWRKRTTPFTIVPPGRGLTVYLRAPEKYCESSLGGGGTANYTFQYWKIGSRTYTSTTVSFTARGVVTATAWYAPESQPPPDGDGGVKTTYVSIDNVTVEVWPAMPNSSDTYGREGWLLCGEWFVARVEVEASTYTVSYTHLTLPTTERV